MGAWTVLPRLVVEAAVIVTFRSSYEYVGIGGNRGHLQQKKSIGGILHHVLRGYCGWKGLYL